MPEPWVNVGQCKVTGCDRDAQTKGMCRRCYTRTLRGKDPRERVGAAIPTSQSLRRPQTSGAGSLDTLAVGVDGTLTLHALLAAREAARPVHHVTRHTSAGGAGSGAGGGAE